MTSYQLIRYAIADLKAAILLGDEGRTRLRL